MSQKTFYSLFFLILILTGIWRFYRLGQVPLGLYWDEVAILADAKKINQTGADLHDLSPWHLIFPSYGDYKLAPYIWSATLSVKFLGVSALALRLPSALAGLFTIIIAGLIAYTLCPKRNQARFYQLTSMFIIAFSPWSLVFSRTGFEGHLAQMWLSLAVLFLLYSQNKKPAWLYALLSGLSGGLAFWSYFSVRFVWPVLIIVLGLYFYRHQFQRSTLFSSLTIITVIFLLMLKLMTLDPFYQASNQFRLSTSSILNQTDLPHQVNQTRQNSGNTLMSRLFFTQKGRQITELLHNYSQHLDFSYLFLTGDANLRHNSGSHGLFFLICLPLLILGLIGLFRADKFLLLVLISWWLIALLPASVPTTGIPHALRTLNALVPSALIIAFAFEPLMLLPLKLKKIALIIISLSFVLALSHFTWYYFHIYPSLSALDWQTNNLRLADILVQEKDNFAKIYTLGLDNRLFLWYLAHPNTDLRQLNQNNQSQDFQFNSLEQIYFNTTPVIIDSSSFLLLGESALVQAYAKEKNLSYQVLYHFQAYGQEFLGLGF